MGAGDVGVGFIQVEGQPAAGVRHPQHAAQQLLYVAAGADIGRGAEDVGEGAIPPLLERLHGDDDLDGAGAVEQIDAIQLALVAGGDGDALGRDLFILDQVLLDRLDVGGLVAVLGLNQQQRPDVVRLAGGQLGQAGAGQQTRRAPRPASPWGAR